MKLYIFFVLSFFFSSLCVAQECPFGITNDPAPGQCGRYIDKDADSYCDLGSVSGDVFSSESENHTCTETAVSGSLSGPEMKQKTLGEIADWYKVDVQSFLQKIEKKIGVPVTSDTKFLSIHDTYSFESKKIKEIIAALQQGEDKHIPPQEESFLNEIFSSFFFYLQRMQIGFLVGMILFFAFLSFLARKKNIRFALFFNWVCYGIAPLLLLGRIGYVGWLEHNLGAVFIEGRMLGYVCLWLLLLILYVKPLSILLRRKKNVIFQSVFLFSCFCMQWRKQLGILVFYLGFAHFGIYLLYWWTTTESFFSFFGLYQFLAGLLGLLALFIGYLTSNIYAIKYFARNRKKIQMVAYPALLFSLLHVFLMNSTVGIVVVIFGGVYAVLKVLEKKI